MKRREFIAGLAAAPASPLVARAQQQPIPRLCFLTLQQGGIEFTDCDDAEVKLKAKWAK